ncbi:MAG TPA: DUF5678 domain-containing protein [Blastocatellia bacterium]|nr:DUF5678 domain-containing protein [Blastocatellia bacterium]HMV82581.1 DUF5678 domain-containing protein [Blastocatellia bacterium]HMX26186.1 DUF5678 domain-containing protein [Blastocatellia bacterium]HMY76907.1 DUF5678 domain-containing protein [Blastocatellia bacterium]HMZ18039.1 DUF5678 domain-containing protein [Blastocatellia bacterium]
MSTQTMELTVENILSLIEKLSLPDKLRLRSALNQTVKAPSAVKAPLDKRVPCEPMPDRARERQWVKDHKHEYAGQWVALDGDQLIAASFTQQEVWDTINADSPNPPLVLRVASPDDLPYVGIL